MSFLELKGECSKDAMCYMILLSGKEGSSRKGFSNIRTLMPITVECTAIKYTPTVHE